MIKGWRKESWINGIYTCCSVTSNPKYCRQKMFYDAQDSLKHAWDAAWGFHFQAGYKQAVDTPVWAWNMSWRPHARRITSTHLQSLRGSGLPCMCERGSVESDSPCCGRPHCGRCPHFRCGWRGWGRWLCGEWRPWFGHQRSREASLEEDNKTPIRTNTVPLWFRVLKRRKSGENLT